MLSVGELGAAADSVMTAALLGQGWETALSGLSRAAGARGVALIRNRDKRLVGAITNAAIAEPIAEYLAGRAPPSSRQYRVSHEFQAGFRTDHDDYSAEDLGRDPFYQDFLRPIGMFWHANARLQCGPGEEVAISFKRELKRGAYDDRDAGALNFILPTLEASARIAHRVLDAEATGMARVLHNRGDTSFELDAWGRVLRVHGTDADAAPVRVVGSSLRATYSRSQSHLNRAIMTAVRLKRPALAQVLGRDGDRHYLQVLPVAGDARDVFLSAAAVAVLLPPRTQSVRTRRNGAMRREVFSLTGREEELVEKLLEGEAIGDIAASLGMRVGTARYHLNNVFGKTGTNRQADLVRLLSRLEI